VFSKATGHPRGGILGWTLGTIALGSLVDLPALGGNLTGSVKFVGPKPAPESIAIGLDNEACGTEQDVTAAVVGADGGLQWAALWISGLHGATASPEKPTMDQKGCKFSPRVVIARPGEEMAILNNDGILHNVHTYSEKNTAMNRAQPGFIKTMPVTFDQPEIIRVQCDVHSWMKGWIVVSDSPHVAVTDAAGSFSMEGVPAGTYQLTAWHGTLGEQTQEVTVREGEDAQVTFEFAGK